MNNLFKQFTLKLKYLVASLNRKRINHVTFIGITGSVGKTMTKELTAAILSSFGTCRKTFLSNNTLESVAGTIWHTGKAHSYCVAELGAYGPGTLDMSLGVLKPDIAVITRIGRDHYAAYKSMEALVAEKEKVLLALPPQGTAVLNIDDPLVKSIGERCNRRIIWFGEGAGATMRLLEAHSRWPETLTLLFEYQDKTYEVRTQLHGTYIATAVLASLGVALAANLPLDKAIEAIAGAQTPEGRMQEVRCDDGVVFIRDDWKAPYWSINEPLEFLKEARAERKIAIIGMISDASGDYGPKYKNIARLCHEFADLVVFVGPHARRGLKENQDKNNDTIRGFRNIKNAAEFLNHELRPGDLVLLKGTNEQDHLFRLILNRSNPIQCWEIQCDLQVYCDACPQLNKPLRETNLSDFGYPSHGPALPTVVGLGNPGARVQCTPHNVGYRVLDKLAESGGGIWKKHPEGWVCELDLQGKAVLLFKPGVAMNNSGIMVRRFLARTGSNPQNCIIVHDDIKLSLGNVRLKSKGGDADHKGMRSILSAFDTEDITRVRLGVGGLDNTRKAKWYGFGMRKDVRKARQFVLTKFSKNEEKLLMPVIEQAAAMIREHVQRQWGG
jgi:UDP-N-acetylmuramoyl-tripeptide--D-alanyl-D-alanine ligase